MLGSGSLPALPCVRGMGACAILDVMIVSDTPFTGSFGGCGRCCGASWPCWNVGMKPDVIVVLVSGSMDAVGIYAEFMQGL